jgi:hypothetical protein
MKDIKTMMDYLIKKSAKIHIVSCPHFKLATLDDIYAESIKLQSQIEGKDGTIADLVENGSL